MFGGRFGLWTLGKEEFCVKVADPAPQNGEEYKCPNTAASP